MLLKVNRVNHYEKYDLVNLKPLKYKKLRYFELILVISFIFSVSLLYFNIYTLLLVFFLITLLIILHYDKYKDYNNITKAILNNSHQLSKKLHLKEGDIINMRLFIQKSKKSKEDKTMLKFEEEEEEIDDEDDSERWD